MGSVDFDINDALKHYMSDPAAIQTPEADGILVDCENDPEALGDIGTINAVLNPIVDAVAENPDAITRSAHFDSLQFLLKCAPISSTPFPSSFTSSAVPDAPRRSSSTSGKPQGRVSPLLQRACASARPRST
jgi:condensin complex subunit 1